MGITPNTGTPRAPLRLEWPALAALGLPLLGFLVMYLPIYLDDMIHVFWVSEDNAHGPLIILVCLWFAWKNRVAFTEAPVLPRPLLGGAVLAFGLLLYVFAVSQDITFLKLVAQWPVISGIILCLRGAAALKTMRFPLGFLVFMLPMPAFVVDGLTQPLKTWVSYAADQILYTAGYPIAREGVTLAIGQYQLLVADACSGLRSLLALSALAVLFVHITARASRLHNGLMLASIIPLALLGNLVRVIILVLVTYYMGDEAGQGFLHGMAGMVVFMAVMVGLLGLDTLLARLIHEPRAA